MPRFTILQHHVGSKLMERTTPIASAPIHWDWLFEPPTDSDDGKKSDPPNAPAGLWTWATDPLINSQQDINSSLSYHTILPSLTVPAVRLPDHRLQYLDYEGEIDGNRGTVVQLVTGVYSLAVSTRSAKQFLVSTGSTDTSESPVKRLVEFNQSIEDSGSDSAAWTLVISNPDSMSSSATTAATR